MEPPKSTFAITNVSSLVFELKELFFLFLHQVDEFIISFILKVSERHRPRHFLVDHRNILVDQHELLPILLDSQSLLLTEFGFEKVDFRKQILSVS